jgi:hypothetical protein
LHQARLEHSKVQAAKIKSSGHLVEVDIYGRKTDEGQIEAVKKPENHEMIRILDFEVRPPAFKCDPCKAAPRTANAEPSPVFRPSGSDNG